MTGPPGKDWMTATGLHIDVRGLEPPQPMVGILARLQDAGADGPVTVHLDRDPIYLYPELVELGWHAERLSGENDEVVLMLSKAR